MGLNFKWIGLTGGIATGKSTVAEMFRQLGVSVIDADHVAHGALVSSSPVFAQIVAAFGSEIVGKDGNIDRTILGKKVFGHPQKLAKLESLVHPFVKTQVALEKQKCIEAQNPLAIYDVPLLFEKNMQKDFDSVVVVACDEKVQLQRLMKRNSLQEHEARLRLQSQWPLAQKMEQADIVIENNGSLDDLKKQVDQVFRKLQTQC